MCMVPPNLPKKRKPVFPWVTLSCWAAAFLTHLICEAIPIPTYWTPFCSLCHLVVGSMFVLDFFYWSKNLQESNHA